MSMKNLFSNFKSTLINKYGENPGNMLVHTGVLGWVLSSLAQISAIVFNDKISAEQKSFLIPQEAADAAVNIISFYVITSSFKKLGSKLVSTGKLTTKPIKDYLTNLGLKQHIGKFNFDIEKDLTVNFEDIKPEYRSFKNGVDIIASVTGSVISCNLLTPVVRNMYASKKQKQAIARMHNKSARLECGRGISMEDYQKLSAMKYSTNGSLKI